MSVSQQKGSSPKTANLVWLAFAAGIVLTGSVVALLAFSQPNVVEPTYLEERAETISHMREVVGLENYRGPAVAEWHQDYAFTFDGNLILVNSPNGSYVVCASKNLRVYGEDADSGDCTKRN